MARTLSAGFVAKDKVPSSALGGSGPEVNNDVDDFSHEMNFNFVWGLMLFSVIKNAENIKTPTRINSG